mgnify:CR=1 FL=1
MNMTETGNALSRKRMELAEGLVKREVIHSVSSLVGELAQNGDEQAVELCLSQPDYNQAAEDYDTQRLKKIQREHGCESLAAAIKVCDDWSDAWSEAKHSGMSAEDFCEQRGIEPHYSEIYEHWIVSERLAEKLAERGQTVDFNFYGLTVWGRPATGRAIALDDEIQEIAWELWRERRRSVAQRKRNATEAGE